MADDTFDNFSDVNVEGDTDTLAMRMFMADNPGKTAGDFAALAEADRERWRTLAFEAQYAKPTAP